MKNYYFMYLILLFIIVLVIIGACYYTINRKDSVIIEKTKIKISETRSKKIGVVSTDFIKLDFSEVVIIYGDIPLDYVYWNFGVFGKNKKCISSISMGKYQAVYPGTSLLIICTNNQCAVNEIKKICEKEHYKRYPNRRLIFEIVDVKKEFNIRYESSFRNEKEKFSPFFVTKYKFDKVYYQPIYIKNYDKHLPKSMEKNNNDIAKILRYKYSHDVYNEVKVYTNIDLDYSSSNTLVNMSEVLDVTGSEKEIRVLAIDHFTSRSSIHSHVMFVDADTQVLFDVFFTGIVSQKIDIDSKTFHVIEITVPEGIKRVKVMERLFFDPNTSSAPKSEYILEMIVYQKNRG